MVGVSNKMSNECRSKDGMPNTLEMQYHSLFCDFISAEQCVFLNKNSRPLFILITCWSPLSAWLEHVWCTSPWLSSSGTLSKVMDYWLLRLAEQCIQNHICSGDGISVQAVCSVCGERMGCGGCGRVSLSNNVWFSAITDSAVSLREAASPLCKGPAPKLVWIYKELTALSLCKHETIGSAVCLLYSVFFVFSCIPLSCCFLSYSQFSAVGRRRFVMEGRHQKNSQKTRLLFCGGCYGDSLLLDICLCC